MASIKGICKSFKCLTQIFVVKDREIEIGYPTDVKHVTHIGWDGTSGSPPSWMSEFKSGPQFSGLSLGRGGETREKNSMDITSWSSQDFDEKSMRGSQAEFTPKSLQPPDLPNIPKKHKRRKSKVTSSPTSASSKPGKSKASKDKKSILDII